MVLLFVGLRFANPTYGYGSGIGDKLCVYHPAGSVISLSPCGRGGRKKLHAANISNQQPLATASMVEQLDNHKGSQEIELGIRSMLGKSDQSGLLSIPSMDIFTIYREPIGPTPGV
ncbi:MAG: hypothetical protein ABW101_04795 [Candidatus Thiodiazotropha sp.]